MDQSLLHKLSLLGVHKLSLSYNSLLQNFQGRRMRSKELKTQRKILQKITSIYSLISPLHVQSSFAGPWSSIYSLRENSPEDEQVAEIWDSTAQILRQFGGKIAALLWPLDPRFLLQVCYEVVIHVAFQNLDLARRILQILDSNLGSLFGL